MKLFPFQKTGVEFLSSKRHALLADEMGLGKSAQAICAADDIVAVRILILCPAVARFTWDREFRKFSAFNRSTQIILDGSQCPSPSHRIVICSYELAVRLKAKGAFANQRFDVLILDEAHFLKNPTAKRTKAVLGKTGLVRHAHHCWMLTGTPMPNHPGEYWVLLKVFGLTRLTYYQFVMKYCRMVPGWSAGDPIQIAGANRAAYPELRKILDRIQLRRVKTEVMKDLPSISFGEILVAPGYYKTTLPEDFDKAEGERGLAEMLLTSPSVATLRRINGLQKVVPVISLVDDELKAKEYDKIIIFCIHREVVAKLYLEFKERGFDPVAVTGETSARLRQDSVDRFQVDPNCKIFIGNIKAAGTAITLTAAHQVLFVEQEWTPGDNAQAAMRCHRIGQTKPVNVRCVGIAGSIDEKINGILRRKTQDITELLGKTQGSEFSEI